MKKYLLPLIASSFIVLFFGVLQAHAALSVVQAQNGGVVTGVSSSLMTLTTTSTVGNLLVIVEGQATSLSPTNQPPTDSAGNNYTLATSSQDATTHEVSLYYSANSLAIATATCNWNTSITSGVCNIYEIAGAAKTSPLDVVAGGFNAGTVSVASTSLYTTTNANDILIFGLRVGANQTTYTPATGWTLPKNASSSRSAMINDIVSAIQTATTTQLTYGTANTYVSVFGAFKAASVASDVTVANGVTITNGVTIR